MRVMRPLPLIGLLLVVWVQEAHACSCRAIVNKRTQNWERPWVGRDVVFTGYAIEIDQSYDPVQRSVTRLVRFVTEQSWRGALPDTITLFVNADAPCSQYSPGWRYLVTANWDARARGRLTTAVCDYSLGADWKVARQLREEEGPPGWTAPPMGSRELDRGAFRLGTPIPRTPAAGLATFIPERGESIVRFEIGDFSGTGSIHGGPILYPRPGLYQLRVTWADGSQFRGYVSIRCESQECLVVRNVIGLKATP